MAIASSFTRENAEPPHIHVERDDATAKFWLQPVRLAHAFGFRGHTLNELARIIEQHEAHFVERWHEHLGR
jgi:hypothetical protein